MPGSCFPPQSINYFALFPLAFYLILGAPGDGLQTEGLPQKYPSMQTVGSRGNHRRPTTTQENIDTAAPQGPRSWIWTRKLHFLNFLTFCVLEITCRFLGRRLLKNRKKKSGFSGGNSCSSAHSWVTFSSLIPASHLTSWDGWAQSTSGLWQVSVPRFSVIGCQHPPLVFHLLVGHFTMGKDSTWCYHHDVNSCFTVFQSCIWSQEI